MEDSEKIYSATLHRFKVDFLDASVTVSIGDTILDALGKVEPSLVNPRDSLTKGMTIMGEEEPWCVIALPKEADVNTIVHECMHAVNYLIHHFELPHNPEDDELMAYMMGYFVDCVFDAFAEHKRVTKKSKKSKDLTNT
jgi:hypothetical protein